MYIITFQGMDKVIHYNLYLYNEIRKAFAKPNIHIDVASGPYSDSSNTSHAFELRHRSHASKLYMTTKKRSCNPRWKHEVGRPQTHPRREYAQTMHESKCPRLRRPSFRKEILSRVLSVEWRVPSHPRPFLATSYSNHWRATTADPAGTTNHGDGSTAAQETRPAGRTRFDWRVFFPSSLAT
jgi:hypothetical protein